MLLPDFAIALPTTSGQSREKEVRRRASQAKKGRVRSVGEFNHLEKLADPRLERTKRQKTHRQHGDLDSIIAFAFNVMKGELKRRPTPTGLCVAA